MPTHITADGTTLFYRDYTPSTSIPPFQPSSAALDSSSPATTLVFIHGWPMSSAKYTHLMLPLCETYRIRCIALDRRGFGRSDPGPTSSLSYDTYAGDAAAVIRAAGATNFHIVAASMGCGESLRAFLQDDYVRRQCRGFIWLGPSLPLPLATAANPHGYAREGWDAILAALRADRAGFVAASLPGVFGAAPAGANVVPAKELERFERIVDQADPLALERCVQLITSTDFTEELERLAVVGREDGKAVKLLLVQGAADAASPYEAAVKLIEGLVPWAQTKHYEGAAHGMYLTHAQQLMDDILEFVKDE